MMKKSFYFIAVFSFVLMLTLSSIFFVSFNEPYFDKMYTKLGVFETIKVDQDTLMEVNELLLDYIKGEEASLDFPVVIDNQKQEFFNQKEKDHMVDVKVLYSKALLVRNLSFFVSLLGISTILFRKDYKDIFLMKQILGNVLISYGLIIGSITLIALIDFDFFWTSFHELVFTNDLWLLNPAKDRLIMMVPLEFFTGLVYRILALVALIFSSLLLGFKFLEKRIKHDPYRTL